MQNQIQNILIDVLKQKWPNGYCNMCGVSSWTVSDKIFQLMEYNNSNIIIGGPVVPVIPVICNNCGNTIFINPKILNII